MKPTYEELEAQVKQLAAERDAVVAENVALKDVVKGVYPNLAIDVSTETVLASLRAEGVDMFAESQKAYVRDNRNSLDAMNRAAYCGSALDAERFAAQLRSKSEVQS